ncbi:hypothetical protein RJ639_021210 [Escallonia herrerae]|uniref:Uncharacterized protein n=1 Tax=Escallonia herrerae TaxID=1293975 RepID=A0AA88V5H3_9ASTE|nr:hypothetical protein RJ639_021210 [Escallonia herrerae]
MPSNPISKLSHLDIAKNHISGNIPEDIATSFPGLRVLTMSANSFTGALSWMVLKINLNHIDGPFPTAICQLQFLQYLDISENNITGILPACFSPSDIGYVQLSKNRLQGPSPHAFFNCTKLQFLDLSYNQLTGPIPKWFDSLSSLSILVLNHNLFEGEILSQFCHLSELSLINLSNNNLSGSIPPCLGNITLRPLLSKFHIQRIVPSITTLDELDTYQDIFVEELLPFVTKSIHLVYRGVMLNYFSAIDLSCNSFVGHIPPDIGRLFHLKSLNLSHNSLSGTIPITFANLTGTESLDLSYNRLTGNVPSQLANLDSLEVFNVSFNNLSGALPQGPHFQTFDGMSYVGNQFLCGKPVSRNCTDPESAPVTPRTRKGTEFMDMDTFYMSFIAAYITMLLGVFAILCINPYWRQAWFHLVEVSLSFCYYFVVDNLP